MSGKPTAPFRLTVEDVLAISDALMDAAVSLWPVRTRLLPHLLLYSRIKSSMYAVSPLN